MVIHLVVGHFLVNRQHRDCGWSMSAASCVPGVALACVERSTA
jgi:hypothetical protein